MLNVVMLSVTNKPLVLSVFMLNVVMMSVVAKTANPFKQIGAKKGGGGRSCLRSPIK